MDHRELIDERGDRDIVQKRRHRSTGRTLELPRRVDEYDVDLLVLGYCGASHTRTDNIGHGSERVVMHSDRPILLV
ncbi:universal stress protein [Haloarchaeobius salinus]|uniref:universal stress protein n=1 Tax=Haloarchaeobius salinus TaxID=1198298 RepID=UPI00210D68E2|nr:universal stress protein [Haloarchaeobius salinus]